MDKIRLIGGTPLNGKIQISGAKNAALPLLAAALLSDQKVHINNVPNLSDVTTMVKLLEQLGVHVQKNDSHSYTLESKTIKGTEASYELVQKMRASILVMGPLLARCGHAEVSLPGGCVIGARPIDLHLHGFEKMGATIELKQGYIKALAPNGLKGATICMPLISVGATENIMMAACLAQGTTQIINAAREPEIVDLANFLNKMGAQIEGAGTDTITIEGVSSLESVTYSVMPDRLETGTYMVAAIITNGHLELTHTHLDLLPTFTSLLQDCGAIIEPTDQGLTVTGSKDKKIKGVDAMTEPYPGFPTDLQAQFMTLMALCDGASMITETIFENRFMHVPELCRMGANIVTHKQSAMVRGVKNLYGAQVMASDLRASFSLVLAGLAAQGETLIHRIHHLDRGYERVEEKLRACGANIERIISTDPEIE